MTKKIKFIKSRISISRSMKCFLQLFYLWQDELRGCSCREDVREDYSDKVHKKWTIKRNRREEDAGIVKQKGLVQLYWTGYPALSIHRRDPATARHGDFCLLRFRPGPVRLSLVNLDGGGSPSPTILMPGLARTPGRHRSVPGRNPALKPSTNPGLRVTGLQEHATTPGRNCASLTTMLCLLVISHRFCL